jgi:hypothetical protein
VATIQLKDDIVLSWFCVVVKPTRRTGRESDQVRGDGTFLDLRVVRCESVENGFSCYYLTRSNRHLSDHLSHERACGLIINGHAHDTIA